MHIPRGLLVCSFFFYLLLVTNNIPILYFWLSVSRELLKLWHDQGCLLATFTCHWICKRSFSYITSVCIESNTTECLDRIHYCFLICSITWHMGKIGCRWRVIAILFLKISLLVFVQISRDWLLCITSDRFGQQTEFTDHDKVGLDAPLGQIGNCSRTCDLFAELSRTFISNICELLYCMPFPSPQKKNTFYFYQLTLWLWSICRGTEGQYQILCFLRHALSTLNNRYLLACLISICK